MNATRTGLFRYQPDQLLYVVDLLGTLVFAIEGALAAIKSDLDFFGLMVLSFVTAVGGGILRDLLIGDIPPNAIRDWRYGATAFTGGAAVFFFYDLVQQIPPSLIVALDAAGLALFAVSGAGKALEYKIHPLLAILMGCITGVGGGTVRDILLAQIPTVLRADVYASAALAGAAVVMAGLKLRFPRALVMCLGAAVCFVLRMLSVWRGWQLPRVIVR